MVCQDFLPQWWTFQTLLGDWICCFFHNSEPRLIRIQHYIEYYIYIYIANCVCMCVYIYDAYSYIIYSMYNIYSPDDCGKAKWISTWGACTTWLDPGRWWRRAVSLDCFWWRDLAGAPFWDDHPLKIMRPKHGTLATGSSSQLISRYIKP